MQLTPNQPTRLIAAAIMSLALIGNASASGFLLDGQGQPVRNSEGHCIQVGALTPADAGFDCPGAKAPQAAATPDVPAAQHQSPPEATSGTMPAATGALPAPEPAPQAAPATAEHKIEFVSRQQFPVNSSYLSVAQKQELLGFVRQLEQYSRLTALAVASHTDTSGAPRYNRWLAGRRDDAVVEYLRSLGVDPRIISVQADAGPGSTPRGVEITATVLERR